MNQRELSFWTLSPIHFDNTADCIFIVNGTTTRGSLQYLTGGNNISVYLRPSISLLPNVEIISGDGTKANAYVVK